MALGSHNSNPSDIPLQDLSSASRHVAFENSTAPSLSRSRSLLQGSSFGAQIGRRISTHRRQRSDYGRIDESPSRRELRPPPPSTDVPDLLVPQYNDGASDLPTKSQLREEVDTALGSNTTGRGSWLPPRNLNDAVPKARVSHNDGREDDGYEDDVYEDEDGREWVEDDEVPLADVANQQPAAGFSEEKRRSIQSVKFAPGPSLGDDLHTAEEGLARSSSKASGKVSRSGSVLKNGIPSRSSSLLSPGSSPVRRVSVALQNMSQRVVNLSNDPSAVEQTIRRRGSSKTHAAEKSRRPRAEISQFDESAEPEEKADAPLRSPSRRDKVPWREQANPLKGNTLRIFSPTSRVRLILCDVLIHP